MYRGYETRLARFSNSTSLGLTNGCSQTQNEKFSMARIHHIAPLHWAEPLVS